MSPIDGILNPNFPSIMSQDNDSYIYTNIRHDLKPSRVEAAANPANAPSGTAQTMVASVPADDFLQDITSSEEEN